MALLTGMTEDGREVPVQVDGAGRLVAEGLIGPKGIQGDPGLQGPQGQKGDTGKWRRPNFGYWARQPWTARASAADNNWERVCWSAEVGLFVAVAASGTGNRVMTSPDGITWVARASAADNDWRSVCWSAEVGRFVAIGGTGTGNRVMTQL